MKVSLVIMAAGLGSRYGGSKQVDGIGPHNEILMEYSIYDAIRAGFSKVVFIIKPEMEEMMHRLCGDYLAKKTAGDGSPVEVAYAFQDYTSLPAFYRVPPERTKPFGTVHALLCAESVVHEPCCVINADDYYGLDAYQTMYRALQELPEAGEAVMVGYLLKNTASLHGTVSRGVCTVKDGLLSGIVERTQIVPCEGGAKFIEGAEETFLPAGTPVSMNMWAFSHSMLEEMESRFPAWLDENVAKDPLKCEYFLPLIPNLLIQEGKGSVRVLNTTERWYGVTYHADLEKVQAAIEQMRASGQYPRKLWK